MTDQAVWSFQSQNGLRATGDLDRKTVDLLLSEAAKPFPIGAREAAVEAGDLPQSETIAGAVVVKRGTEGAGTLEIADAISKPLADGHSLVDKLSSAKTLSSSVSTLFDWAVSRQGLKTMAVLGVCIFIWHGAHRVVWARVKDFALGRNIGR